jgi:hypothetical protein
MSLYEKIGCQKMSKRILFFALFVTLIPLAGCDPDSGGVPEIVGNIGRVVIEPMAEILTPPDRTAHSRTSDSSVPSTWYPPRKVEKPWRAIVIHHSLTTTGNARVFDDYHKNGKKWKGVGYDFVIGNGSGAGNGQVEVTFRWTQQIAGAHVGGTPKNWANEDAVGICLVGNFTNDAPTYRQMQALAKLTRFLQKRYNIPTSRIYSHRSTPGYTGGTGCPGNFPMSSFKAML